jgi:predicted AAA+ superfamily ATPase
MPQNRYLQPAVADMLGKKMVFLGGPRQVGKTTLCLGFLKPSDVKNPAYLNWDDLQSRSLLRKGHLPPAPLLILDEIHKYKLWRGLVKGFYDKNKGSQNYLVTGSARLDLYRKGGDSLMGRYRYLRLHPFSVNELSMSSSNDLESLLKFGGFPEPFLRQSEREQKLWCKERQYRIVNDDITGLESLNDYSRIETLMECLNPRVGSLLSLQSLEEDLQVTQKTVAHWVEILERVYYLFRIYPYGAPKIRALKKMPKVYFWDWGEVEEPGPKFENMVASHLLKYCHFLEDTEGEKMELRYLRDTDQREIDFVVLKNKRPLFAVECKTGEKNPSKWIGYFKQRTSIPQFYQVHRGTADYAPQSGVRVMPFLKFCKELRLP